MIRLNNSRGFSAIEVLLICIVLGILSFTGWFVYHAQKGANKDYSAPVSKRLLPTNKKVPTTKPVTTPIPSTKKVPAKTFNFIDMTGWAKRSPTNQSFTVEFGAYETYGYCTDNTGVLLIGMVYMNQKNRYDCSGVMNAVTPQNGGSLLLTKVAIGPSEQLWDRGNAQPITVKLPQGEDALRYTYTDTIEGTPYETIEYDVTYQGKSYVAVLHWKSSEDINSGSNIRPDYFDTIVQKTLVFN